jgi:hypothetical protein
MKTTEKNLETVVNEINNVYSKKGLNGVYAFKKCKNWLEIQSFTWNRNNFIIRKEV